MACLFHRKRLDLCFLSNECFHQARQRGILRRVSPLSQNSVDQLGGRDRGLLDEYCHKGVVTLLRGIGRQIIQPFEVTRATIPV